MPDGRIVPKPRVGAILSYVADAVSYAVPDTDALDTWEGWDALISSILDAETVIPEMRRMPLSMRANN